MNNQLIPVVPRPVGTATIPTVDARELHAFLEVKSRFNDWIANRIKDFDFVENHDFVTFTKNLVSGGQTKEYALTLDMGKELSMVERNAKGKQARQYFIECERLAKQTPVDPSTILDDPAAMRGLLLTYTEKVLALEATVTEQKARVESMKNWGTHLVAQVVEQEQQIGERDKMIAVAAPKAAALDKIALADGTLSLSDAAKTIGVQPQKVFIPRLCSEKWIFRRAGGNHWIAYQDKLQQMLLEHKVTTLSCSDGTERITEQVRVTPKGLAKLAVLFKGGVK